MFRFNVFRSVQNHKELKLLSLFDAGKPFRVRRESQKIESGGPSGPRRHEVRLKNARAAIFL
jgi:hypothetical protein